MTLEGSVSHPKVTGGPIPGTEATPTYERSLTPAGIEIHFEREPKRLYRVRGTNEEYAPDDRDWLEVPSVSTVIECLEKGGLSWWGMEIGVSAVMHLLVERAIVVNCGYVVNPAAWEGLPLTVSQVVDLLKQHKLDVNKQKGKAARRGTSVHRALEVWATTGSRPDPTIFPPEEQGYVVGLLAFLNDVPSAEPVASEVMVGSLEHGFAGRYDIRFRTTQEHAVVVHRTPKKGPQYAKLEPGLYLGDLKTSKDVYQKSHGRQLEAYEGASVECGYEPTDGRGVINVNADGTYKFVRSVATYDHFLHALQTYRDDEEIKERSKR